MNALVPVTCRPFTTITTSTVPAACAGVVQTMVVGFTDVIAALLPPKETTVAPFTNPVPVMATAVPPDAVPEVTSSEVSPGR